MTSAGKETDLNAPLKIPMAITDLLINSAARNQAPLRFILKDKPFNIKIQYFLDIESIENHNPSNGIIKFAVTTDGFDLLVNTRSEGLDILQDEFGSFDELGISFLDLIDAQKEKL